MLTERLDALKKAFQRFWAGPVIVETDGACLPRNPGGYCSSAYVIRRGSKVIKQAGRYIGVGGWTSNNVGEINGVIDALQALLDLGLEKEEIVLRMDSNIVATKILKGRRYGSGAYAAYLPEMFRLLKPFKNLTVRWIPREENTAADALTKEALKPHYSGSAAPRKRRPVWKSLA